MDFKSWLCQIKLDKPNLDAFITKLEPFFTDAGFNGFEFEKKVTLRLQKLNDEIDESLKPISNAEIK